MTTTQASTRAHGEPFFVGGAYRPEDTEARTQLIASPRTVTRKEFLASLVAAGIHAPDGALEPPYASNEPVPTT